MQGWVDLIGWLHTDMVYPPADGHPSSTNRARRRVTSLIRRTTLNTTPCCRIAALVLDAAYWYRCSVVSLSVCLFVTRAWAVLKRLNRSRCHLWCDLVGPKKPRSRWCPDPLPAPHMKEHFWDGHAWICSDLPAVVFTTLFTRGQQRCGLWLQLVCIVHSVS